MTMTNRAYSLLEIKSYDDDKRIITGIATTPTTDRQGDIVESDGAEFKLPIPLLWQHNSEQPIGHVISAKVSPKGITVTAQLAKIDEPGTLKDRLDEAWHSMKSGLVRGLSIGFKPLESARIEETYGQRFIKWLWLELSAVTIAANGECSITQIKKIDTAQRAATGQFSVSSGERVQITPPASGKSKSTTPVKAQEGKTMKKTFAEQISAFSATREAKSADMDKIMDDAAESGVTLDADQKEKYDTLEAEVKEIDDHIVRLKAAEERNKKAAVAVNGTTTKAASDSRQGHHPVVTMQRATPKGVGFVRLLGARFMAKEESIPAYQIAESKGWGEELVEVLKMPQHVLKAAIAAGTTTDSTWAGPLVTYNNLQEEFIELLRPNALISRIPGLRRVPFNVKVPRETATMTAYWVGQGSPKPVTKGALDTVTLDFAKIAGITYQTQELLRFARPNSEQIMVNSLTKAIQYLMDRDFLDPAKAASTGVSPASITNGSTSITATGITSDAFRADFASALTLYSQANYSLDGLVIAMTQTQAMRLSLMRTDFNQKLFPDLSKDGGSLEGIPVITSENIVANGGSPADGALIAFINAGDILLADDGSVDVDISTEASIQADSAPDSPATASTVLVSLWQNNLVGIRCERYINWTKARSDSVVYITGGNYSTAS
jgi:HK97 family phage major capsid protein/HK97 family phage prohead protease